MATKSKAASRPAAKKAEPVVIESIDVEARQDGVTLTINGVEHTLTVQQFLGLRNDISGQAAGLVH